MVWILPIVVTPELSTIVTIPPKSGHANESCNKGNGASVGRCIRHGSVPQGEDRCQHNGTLLMRGRAMRGILQ